MSGDLLLMKTYVIYELWPDELNEMWNKDECGLWKDLILYTSQLNFNTVYPSLSTLEMSTRLVEGDRRYKKYYFCRYSTPEYTHPS